MSVIPLRWGSFRRRSESYGGQDGGQVNTLILNRETFEMPADGWYPTSRKATADKPDCEVT